MKISKQEATKLINKSKNFDAVSFNSLSNKRKTMKEIEVLLRTNATVIVIT
jgi:hypothetical protein